ncbi:unnamed protein product [Cylicostephanus goldi]|uniref:U4/U6.U5 small nuclear ribonucleoprotein 27 kDa protein n=1 Tax=Cylicostephanus goldi TaxID=71465 RepID=A0A3P7R289_CYLGO|nr:unnamed protein product [Cylicostephanus goldi]
MRFPPFRSQCTRDRYVSSYDISLEPISLEQIVNCEQDLSALMGFAGFDTTKNKKVSGNYEGAVKINKPRRYRQYMNRKGGFNRPLDYIA